MQADVAHRWFSFAVLNSSISALAKHQRSPSPESVIADWLFKGIIVVEFPILEIQTPFGTGTKVGNLLPISRLAIKQRIKIIAGIF